MARSKSILMLGNKVLISYRDLTGTGVDGYFDPSKSEIVIHSKHSKDYQLKTLMHEVFHAWCHHSGIRQGNFSIDFEELICESFCSRELTKLFKISLR